MERIERTVLSNLIYNEEYTRRVLPFIKEEYFSDRLEKILFTEIHNFVNKYNWKKTPYFAPIASGYNINGFDMIIVDRMCEQFGPYDKERGQQTLFNKIHRVDVMPLVWGWLEDNKDIKSLSLDSLRDYFGMSKDNAHDALQDVKDTANLLIRFLKMQRKFASKVQFEKAFADMGE